MPPQECRAPSHPCSGLGPHGLWVSPAPPGMLQDRFSAQGGQVPGVLIAAGDSIPLPSHRWLPALGQAWCRKLCFPLLAAPAQVVPLLWPLQLPVACGYCQIPSILSSTCFFFFFFSLAFCKSIHFFPGSPGCRALSTATSSSKHCPKTLSGGFSISRSTS